jgi:hypothetical protein
LTAEQNGRREQSLSPVFLVEACESGNGATIRRLNGSEYGVNAIGGYAQTMQSDPEFLRH